MEYTLSGAVFLYKEYPRIVCAEVGYCRWCEKDCMSNKRTSPLCVKGGVKGGLLLQEVMSFHAETWWVMIAPCGTSYDLRYAQSRGGATHLFIKQSLSLNLAVQSAPFTQGSLQCGKLRRAAAILFTQILQPRAYFFTSLRYNRTVKQIRAARLPPSVSDMCGAI